MVLQFESVFTVYTSDNNMAKQSLLCSLHRSFLVKQFSVIKYKHILKVWTGNKDSTELSQVQNIVNFLKQGLS